MPSGSTFIKLFCTKCKVSAREIDDKCVERKLKAISTEVIKVSGQ